MTASPRLALAIALAAAVLAGCASQSGSVYSREEAQREQVVRMATVEAVRHVQIAGTKSPVGALAGGAVGAIAGSSLGGGRGAAVTGILGALAGGMGGATAEEALTRQAGLEITVRLDNGEIRSITQAADESFAVGERVRLLSSGGKTRVTH
jgi:outer membrane lipoprotein SlyB